MDGQNISTGKVAAVVGLGVGAMLVLQADPLKPGGTWSSIWKEAGLPGAPAWLAYSIIAGLSLLTFTWLYRLLVCPLELLRGPDDVGYIAEDGRSKAQAANEVRRRRKTGELPPVYPNGWYRVLDSHLLERGEVKQVSILGMISDITTANHIIAVCREKKIQGRFSHALCCTRFILIRSASFT